jgi:hypothetical protein
MLSPRMHCCTSASLSWELVLMMEQAGGMNRNVWTAPMVMKNGAINDAFCVLTMPAVTSAADHEPSRGITKQTHRQQRIDVLNTPSYFLGTITEPSMAWIVGPTPPELLLLGALGISRNTYTTWLVQPTNSCHVYLMFVDV